MIFQGAFTNTQAGFLRILLTISHTSYRVGKKVRVDVLKYPHAKS